MITSMKSSTVAEFVSLFDRGGRGGERGVSTILISN